MKIRMLGNSIRLRLSQSDLDVLSKHGKVTESVNFPNGQTLTYALSKQEVTNITVEFRGAEIETFIPIDYMETWLNTNRVGFDQSLELPNGSIFKILIEKDFKCLTDREEDESDLFPHPQEKDLNC